MGTLGFIILRHVNNDTTNQYWNLCYERIRKYYPESIILIVDDNSQQKYINSRPLYKTLIVQSEYPGRGELLCPGGAAADTARPNSRDRGKLGPVDRSAAGLCRGSHLLENRGVIRHLAAHQRAAPVFIVVAVATNPSTWHYASRG